MSNSLRHKNSAATQKSNPQGARAGPHNNITDVPGLGAGNAHHEVHMTGVTVVMPKTAWTCAVDVRGGGPGTRETDLLDPGTLVNSVDALVLSGGSTYGLAAADGVTTQLGAQNKGFSLIPKHGVLPSPIVPAAILYDLANNGNKDWGTQPPYRELGIAALDDVSYDCEMAQGQVGAGYGALSGQEKGGLGSASIMEGDLIVGALMAVNSFGSVRMPGSQCFWAWPYELDGEFGSIKPDTLRGACGFPDDTKLGPLNLGGNASVGTKENTTIGVVALSHPLHPNDAKRVAIMAQDGLARAIRPVHAPTDGDVLFVLAPPPAQGRAPADPITITRLGNLAADCVARAIAKGVFEANK